MNCKQGDLAIIVKSRAGNEGKIVTCLRLATEAELFADNFTTKFGPVWVTDLIVDTCNVFGISTGGSHHVCDVFLRPIRDQDGEDEMIRIAGKPVIQELPQTIEVI